MSALPVAPRRWPPLLAPLAVAVALAASACNRNPVVNVAPPATGPEEPAAPVGPPLFADRTPGSGVDFTYRNGEERNHLAILESLGGGCALIDYDGDGKLDLFVVGGGGFRGADGKEIFGLPGKLYRNLGDWKFADVTKEAGLDAAPVYTHGVTVLDYDRDGWPDLFVTGYGRHALYHNVADGQGGRKFVDVTQAAGLLTPHFWGTSAAAADFDGDGYPDLYVCQYVPWSWENHPPCPGYRADVKNDICAPKAFGSVPHAVYHNVPDGQGGRKYVDVSKEAGLRAAPRDDKDYGKGLGVLAADFDGDGKPDVYVANDTTDNFLYLNRSTKGQIRFEEKGRLLGVAKDANGIANGSMGVDCADFEGSGLASIFVANYENELHALYRNVMDPQARRLFFTYHTSAAGLGSLGTNFVGFGAAFLDYDRDGWEDILISNGHVVLRPPRDNLRQPPVLFRNVAEDGRRKFRDASPQGGPYFAQGHRGRGLAVGDLDNDGRTDFVSVPVNEPVRLLRNEAAPDNHWLGVELRGRDHRDIVGARLTLEVAGRKLVRFAKGGGSYLSSPDRRIVFGLAGDTTAGTLTVEWPHGGKQEFVGLAIDRYHRLEEK